MDWKKLPKEVQIVEVGPRDGLQNESASLSVSDRVNYIQKLIKAGCSQVEVGSFVSAKAIPQMSDTDKVFEQVKDSLDPSQLICLVPNLKGLELAEKSGVKTIAVFTSPSNTFNQKNINATVEESLLRIGPVIKEAKAKGIKVRGYVSTVFGCPYEGNIRPDQVLELTEKLLDWGAYEVSLGDTIGIAHPKQVQEFFQLISGKLNPAQLAMHFHDTRGLAVTNILVSLLAGVRVFDGASGGLGGCPYAKGATGNVATEDLCHFFHSMGVSTGIKMEKLIEASQFILDKVGKTSCSKAYQAFHSNR